MKIFFIAIICLLIKNTAFSQSSDTVFYSSGFSSKTFYYQDKRVGLNELKDIMYLNNEALTELEAARNNRTLAKIIGGVSGFILGWQAAHFITREPVNYLYIGAGITLLSVSVPISINSNKKAFRAVKLYNEGIKQRNTQNLSSFNLHIGAQSIGIRYSF